MLSKSKHTRLTPIPWRRAGWLVVSFSLAACSGEIIEENDSDLSRIPTSPAVKAVCNVSVSGYGTLSVEDNYLPHVLFCEIAAAVAPLSTAEKLEALKAQAIAARTFTYDRLSWKSKLSNSVNDQVYSDSHCKGTVPSIFRQAVDLTRGMVMLKPSGNLHQGYYRAGTNVCKKHGTCDGQPCMGQRNAAKCADQGHSWRYILDISYNYPTIVRASGSCTGAGGLVEPGGNSGPQSCFYAGAQGTCQSTSTACNGTYRAGLCPGTPTTTQCCLPPSAQSNATWGSCSYSGATGTCQSSSTTACGGYYRTGLCPGSNDIKCCLSWGGCTYNGQSGACQSDDTACSGTYRSGLCPGPSNIRCCVP